MRSIVEHFLRFPNATVLVSLNIDATDAKKMIIFGRKYLINIPNVWMPNNVSASVERYCVSLRKNFNESKETYQWIHDQMKDWSEASIYL